MKERIQVSNMSNLHALNDRNRLPIFHSFLSTACDQNICKTKIYKMHFMASEINTYIWNENVLFVCFVFNNIFDDKSILIANQLTSDPIHQFVVLR